MPAFIRVVQQFRKTHFLNRARIINRCSCMIDNPIAKAAAVPRRSAEIEHNVKGKVPRYWIVVEDQIARFSFRWIAGNESRVERSDSARVCKLSKRAVIQIGNLKLAIASAK